MPPLERESVEESRSSLCELDEALRFEADCPSPCDELLRSRLELLDEPLMPPLFASEREPDPVFELFF